ncbi:hypothetical protein N7510_002625 [Penicillium lagena]|uniref:uncharacterized protein n=1 Tax=Penicillium lagena TaxID=94218 RepID=UPI00254253D4|nr:uncharacterized protein N7510_002625 [Penicillium lagena]KAJ5626316.1 hypothetical protein N7510_002625 [Penicillium lagena]
MSQGCSTGPEFDEGLGSNENQNFTENTPEKSWDASTAIDAAWITDLGLSPVVLEHLLDRFRGMASYFPFVRLSYAWTAASMAANRPFLLLAAITAASSNSHMAIGGTGKLTNTRFHFHFVPGSQQTYQYLQIAISMVIDLRLDQEATDFLEQRTELSDTYIREACPMSSGKPNNLQFHEGMLQCAMVLQQQPELETDLLIYPLTKVLQFVEEVCETYQSEGINCPRLYIYAERFTTRLEEWWSSLSTDLRNTVLLINCYHGAKIRIQEMGLVYCYGQRRPPSSKVQEDSTILTAPSMVISNLLKCVSSTKEYLDSFLAIPAAEHNTLPFSTWYHVILTVFVLYRLSVGLPEIPEWDVEIAQQTVDLQGYLNALLSHLQAIKPSPDRQIPTNNLFAMLPEIIESVQASYALAKENIAQVRDSRRAPHELKASNNTVSSVQRLHRCPALRYSSRHAVQVPTQPTLRNAIATEVQRIEDEKLLGDLLLMDTFSSMTGSLSGEL